MEISDLGRRGDWFLVIEFISGRVGARVLSAGVYNGFFCIYIVRCTLEARKSVSGDSEDEMGDRRVFEG